MDHRRIVRQKLEPPEERKYEELDMISNFFKLDIDPTMIVYQYSFRILFGNDQQPSEKDDDEEMMPEMKKWQERVLRENYSTIVDTFFATNFPRVRYFHDFSGIRVFTINKKLDLQKDYKNIFEVCVNIYTKKSI